MKFLLFLFPLLFISCQEKVAPVELQHTTDAETISPKNPPIQIESQNQETATVQKYFRITVHERGMTFDENYIFSNDSIFGIGKLEDGKSVQKILIDKKTSEEDADKIISVMEKLNLDSLANGNKSKTPDGKTIFTFAIMKGMAEKDDPTGKSITTLFDALSTYTPKQKTIVPGTTYISMTVAVE